MGGHTLNFIVLKDLTLRLSISLHNSYLKILKSGKQRECIFLRYNQTRILYYNFWPNAELVTQTIITCNCIVKTGGG
jgi:hypothetical protein